MKSVMPNKKTIKEQSLEELLPHLLALGEGSLSKLELGLMEEVLIKNNSFNDLTEIIQLTTFRQKQVFANAVKRLIRAVDEAKKKSNAYPAMEKELTSTKKKLETLEESINRKNKLSPEVKELLALKIDTLGFSSRLVNVCFKAHINIVADLVCLSRREFLSNRDCGELSINEVDTFLKKKGLEWEMKI